MRQFYVHQDTISSKILQCNPASLNKPIFLCNIDCWKSTDKLNASSVDVFVSASAHFACLRVCVCVCGLSGTVNQQMFLT